MTDFAKEARALAKAATEGPWRSHDAESNQYITTITSDFLPARADGVAYVTNGYDVDQQNADAAFIAASRTLVPSLCDLAEKQAAEIEKLRAALWYAENALAQFADEPVSTQVEMTATEVVLLSALKLVRAALREQQDG